MFFLRLRNTDQPFVLMYRRTNARVPGISLLGGAVPVHASIPQHERCVITLIRDEPILQMSLSIQMGLSIQQSNTRETEGE